MDGWGYSPVHEGNAIWAAKTPNFDNFWNLYNHLLLNSFGENVGLPWGSIGSSEVGHTAIGSGYLKFHELSLVDKEIMDGSFFKNKNLLDYVSKAKNKGDMHLIGLVSNGGVHSQIKHLFSLLELLKKEKFSKKIFIHAITDGRDTGPKEALQFFAELNKTINKLNINAKIATVSGRYYTMDRDNRWNRTHEAYLAMTEGKGDLYNSPEEAVKANYARKNSDEFIVPSVIQLTDKPRSGLLSNLFGKKKIADENFYLGTVKENDNVIFFNIRPDRMIQITETFLFPKNEIKTKPIKNLNIITMATYNEFLPVSVAYPTVKVKEPLAKVLSDHHLRQGHFAETEKYVHVTYFFNGGNSKPYPGETWNLVPSPKVKTYDLKPEMSANEITKKVFEITEKEKLDFVIINYANADMVGHTGKFDKVVKAVESVDKQLGKLKKFTPESTIIITADHGNAECMVHPETGEIDKHHTVNPVPFIIVNDNFKQEVGPSEELVPAGILADIAPTILHFYGIEPPALMNGVNLASHFKAGDTEEKAASKIEQPQAVKK